MLKKSILPEESTKLSHHKFKQILTFTKPMSNLRSKFLCILIVLFCATSFLVQAQNNDLVFHRLTVNDGISNGNVCQIFQDSKGFVWMATEEGLNLFDGYTFKTFKHNSTDSTSISNNNILSIIEDKQGSLWIGTSNGLNVLNRSTLKFTKFFFNPKQSNSISSDRITKLCIDNDNQIWIGTDNGLNRFNPENKDFTRFNVVNDLSQNIKGNWISDIVCDKKGIIWTSEYFRGIYRIDPKTNSIKNYPVNAEGSFLKNIVISICPNPNGNLWLGLLNGQIIDFNPYSEKASYLSVSINQSPENNSIKAITQSNDILWYINGKVLVRYDIRTRSAKTYSNDPVNPESLPKGTPLSISQTRDGNIWIGLEGIVYFSAEGEKFSPFYHILPKESKQIKQNFVTTFYVDRDNNLFLGTFLDGLIRLNQKTGQFERLNTPAVFSGSVISDIQGFDNHKFWVATSKGLVLYNPHLNKNEKHYIHFENDPNSIYHDAVEIVRQDRNNNLWIATQESLDFISMETNTFIHRTRENLGGLSHYKVTAILEDRDGYIWVGTYRGLNKIDPKTMKITQYLPSLIKDHWISDPMINRNGLYQDKSGIIWICTKNGLNAFDPKNNSFITYFQSDGLLSDNVYRVFEDNTGNLWVTSGRGVSKINMTKKTFQNYTSLDGLDINTESLYKDSSGLFYVGGRHENFYRFNPDNIPDNQKAPDVFITDLLLFNKPVGIFPSDKSSPLKQNIFNTKELILNYKQSDFAFEFTALNYLLPEKNRFAYKMEGFNEDWIYTDSKRRVASYTNLRRGEYIFRVKAANNDGVWNEEGTSIKVKILPAPWETNLALSFYGLLILVSLYFARSVMKRQIQLQNSLRLEHFEREKENEFIALKTKFFTNISHEFRTPLTLISGPIHKLINAAKESKSKEDDLKYYYLIERNVNRISQLTNQLLDFRKIETGTLKLEIYQGDLVRFIQNIIDRFDQFAHSKNISLQLSTSEKSIEGWFDPDKLEKIISNLLSNALKFTSKNGTVSLNIELNPIRQNSVIITVQDSGIGITPENLKKVFDRFYQVDRSVTSIFEGTGIGLALAKDMAILCNGDIIAESEVGKGTAFIVNLPIDRESFSNYSIISELTENEIDSSELYEPLDQNTTNKLDKPDNETKPTILIIEDNKDLRFFIADILKDAYHTVETENGLQGLEQAFKIIPDIIVCDVMMPEKDGIEVTKAIKQDPRTSHIPVVLVTALSSIDNQLKGLETGADDYITKPFVPEILILKIQNRLIYRQRVKEYLLKSIDQKVNQKTTNINLEPKELVVNSIDEKIISQALEIVEQNISDPDFNVDKFSAAIGMESSTLYKKLMALIDMPPGEFIRDIRMKRAVQLLDQNKISISEIAYMVGFDSPNYFSKVFKKYYEISPTDYLVQKKNNNENG